MSRNSNKKREKIRSFHKDVNTFFISNEKLKKHTWYFRKIWRWNQMVENNENATMNYLYLSFSQTSYSFVEIN